MTDTFDLVVLGAGSGGLATAKRAAAHGATVAIIEHGRVGGTCVIRGCIPKKLMVYASHLGAMRHLAVDYGWSEAPDAFSWKTLCDARDQTVARLEASHVQQLDKAKVRVIRGQARFIDAHTVRIGDEDVVGRHVVIATGATPTMPAVPGGQDCLISDDLFGLAEMPHSALLVGGSYIAVEFAAILQGLGCQTTLVARGPVLRHFDHDIQRALVASMRQHGMDVHEETQIEQVTRATGKTWSVRLHGESGSQTVTAQACVLFAIGRVPHTADLGLSAIGVKTDADGAVLVDALHATSVPNIYAVGDVINRVNLTPVAIKAARSVADRLFGPGAAAFSYDNVATAVFSDPPVSAVGLTEAQARVAHGDAIKVYTARFGALLYSFSPAQRRETTLMKLIVHGPSDRVLGFHMFGPDAPEIIQGFAVAVQAGLTKAQLDATVAIHPSQAEEFVLMR